MGDKFNFLSKNFLEKYKEIITLFFNEIKKDSSCDLENFDDFIEELMENINRDIDQIEKTHCLREGFMNIYSGIKSYMETYNLGKKYLGTKNTNKVRKDTIRSKCFFSLNKILISLNKDKSEKKEVEEKVEENVKAFFQFWSSLCLLKSIVDVNLSPEKPIDEFDNNLNKNTETKSQLIFLFNFLKNIESLLLILSESFDLKPKFENNLNEFYAHMLMYLKSNNHIISTENKISALGKVSYSVSYNIKTNITKNEEESVSNDIFLFKIKKYNIFGTNGILFKNKNYDSFLFKKNSYLTFYPDPFQVNNLIKKNPRYGYLNLNKKKKINPELNIKNDFGFVKFSNKKVKEKLTINLDFFMEIFNHLKKNIGLDESTQPWSDQDKVYLLLINYKNSQSNHNKNRLQNVLILLELMQIYNIFKKKGYFYFNFFFDFRSRFYYNSISSLTSFKLSRFYLTSEDYTEQELNSIISNNKESKSFELYLDLYKKYENNILKLKSHDSLNLESDQDKKNFKKCLIISSLLSLGSITKSEILNKKNNYYLDVYDIIEEGLKHCENFKFQKEKFFNNIKDSEDEFKFKSIFKFFFDDINLKKKFYIGLDFSASGHQLRYLRNTFEDLSNYSLINVNSKDHKWVDIYSFLIEGFKKELSFFLKKDEKCLKRVKNRIKIERINKILDCMQKESNKKLIEELIDKVFKRTFLKKSIMTTEYNVTFIEFFKYCKNSLKKKNLFILDNLQKEEKEVIDFIFSYFYDFCKNVDIYLDMTFKKNNKDIEEILSKVLNFKLTHSDGFCTGLACFKEGKKILRTTYVDKNKKRLTLVHKYYTDIIDSNKTKNSLIPNYIHSLDAVLLRFLLLYKWWSLTPFFTIHDEYWLPIQEKLMMLDHINFIIKKDLVLKDNQTFLNFFEAKEIKNKTQFEEKFSKLFNSIDERIEEYFSHFIII